MKFAYNGSKLPNANYATTTGSFLLERFMPYVSHSLQVAAAILLLVSVFLILFKPSKVGLMSSDRLPQLVRYAIAFAFALSAIAMIFAIMMPFFAFFVACFSAMAASAMWFMIVLRGNRRKWQVPVGLIIISGAVAAAQPLGLKVIALPSADTLPYEPAFRTTILKTYDKGVWFESVRAATDGTLYLSANRDLDFSLPDYYRRAHGEIIERRQDGSEKTVFSTSLGSASGVIAIAADGTLFVTSHGSTSGIWRMARDGSGATLLTTFPAGSWPNGIDFGPDGMIYVADSELGNIWRVDPRTGTAISALSSNALAARAVVALAPGANGLHFVGQEMLVTVSDKTTILKFRLEPGGKFSIPETVASGVPGDDFAIGKDGSLFVTTHPYNTLVRVASDGRRTVIGDQRQHIVGATDAVFGRGPQDQSTLYVVTDGGAFAGGADAQGQLIALTP